MNNETTTPLAETSKTMTDADALRQERDSLCWQRMEHAEEGTQEAFYRCDARIAAIDEELRNMEPSTETTTCSTCEGEGGEECRLCDGAGEIER